MYESRKSPKILFRHCSRGLSDFSNMKRLFILKLGFLHFSFKLSRLKKMFYLTSNTVILGVFFIIFIFFS